LLFFALAGSLALVLAIHGYGCHKLKLPTPNHSSMATKSGVGSTRGVAKVHCRSEHQRPSQRVHLYRMGNPLHRDVVASAIAEPPRKTRTTRKKKTTKTGGGGSYNLLLHNDEVNPKDYVVIVLTRVVGIEELQANEIMETAHNEGKAVVSKCDEAKARDLCQKLRENGLTSTVEPN